MAPRTSICVPIFTRDPRIAVFNTAASICILCELMTTLFRRILEFHCSSVSNDRRCLDFLARTLLPLVPEYDEQASFEAMRESQNHPLGAELYLQALAARQLALTIAMRALRLAQTGGHLVEVERESLATMMRQFLSMEIQHRALVTAGFFIVSMEALRETSGALPLGALRATEADDIRLR